jgi:hypothetical protein
LFSHQGSSGDFKQLKSLKNVTKIVDKGIAINIPRIPPNFAPTVIAKIITRGLILSIFPLIIGETIFSIY